MANRLLANASELGLFSGLATSRARLILSGAAAVALTMGYGFALSRYLNERSTDVGLNVVWITLQLLLVLVAGYVVAMGIGAHVFGDGWRRRTFLGERPAPASEGGEELEIDALRDHSMAFYGIVAASVAAVYVALTLATGGYISAYNEVGYFRTLLRSDVAEERVRALRGLVDPVNYASAQSEVIREQVTEAVRDPDPEVAAWAAWAAGHREMLATQPALLQLALDGSAATEARVEAAHALGRLRDPLAERRLAAALAGAAGEERLAGAFATALGLMNATEAVPALVALVGTGSAQLDAQLFWALRQSRSTEPRQIVVSAWQQADNLEARCAAAEALKMASTLQDVEALRAAFAETERGTRCEAVERAERLYDDEEPMDPITYVVGEPLRKKYLTALFNIRPPGLAEWLAEVAWTEAESDEMKVYADNLYQALEGAPHVAPRE